MSSGNLEVLDLRTYFFTPKGVVRAVDGIEFTLRRGETLALVGESGCGKSAAALSVMRLIPFPPGITVAGQVLLDGVDLLKLSEADMCRVRGGDIAMIFQEPMTSLNPVYTIGFQISEAMMAHSRMNRDEARSKALELLSKVGIPSPERRIDDFPHQMSGGMRQRVMISMALANNPRFLIADEPTTALDVTIQAQILSLMMDLQEEYDMGILLITHDFGVVAEAADRVAVMYAGQIVEEAPVRDLLEAPIHPYTCGLIASVPQLHQPSGCPLHVIEGSVPDPISPPPGCRFAPRCPNRDDECGVNPPVLREIAEGRSVRCHKGGACQ